MKRITLILATAAAILVATAAPADAKRTPNVLRWGSAESAAFRYAQPNAAAPNPLRFSRGAGAQARTPQPRGWRSVADGFYRGGSAGDGIRWSSAHDGFRIGSRLEAFRYAPVKANH